MAERENNIRQISQFLRDIQQISEYSTNRNTFNVNINYYEKYYNGYENEETEEIIRESQNIDRNIVSRQDTTNRYFFEINGERVNNDTTASAVNQQNTSPQNNSLNTDRLNTQNAQNIESENIQSSLRSNPNIIRRQITIPLRTTGSNWIADIDSTYSLGVNSTLSDINNVINQTLNDTINSLNLETFNGSALSTGNNSLTLAELNAKTSLLVYSLIDSENRETKCHICNEDYCDNDICRKNNLCGHYLHQTCLDNWYSTHNTCPICNRVV